MRAVVAASVVAILSLGALVIWRSSQAIHSASEDVRAEHEFRFVAQPLPQPVNAGFEQVSSPAVFLQAARFEDHLYIASPAGLLEYTPEGALLHQYAVGRELPGSPLIALATGVLADSHDPELVVATANDGLLAFNGRSFRQILPTSTDARAITAILPAPPGIFCLEPRSAVCCSTTAKRSPFSIPHSMPST